MATAMHEPIDLDKQGNYPIILSDALLGKGTKEAFTSIKYNHEPPSSTPSNSSVHIKPSSPSNTSQYKLSISDNDEKYSYEGPRQSGDGQYVLIFDPARKAFVLHQVDSSFDMNITSTPWNPDAENIRSTYSRLETSSKPQRGKTASQTSKISKEAKSAKADKASDQKRKKAEKPKKAKPPPREPSPEAEDEDSDDGLLVEYPDANPPAQYQSRSTPLIHRQVSEELSVEGESDAEYEEDDDDNNDRNRDVEILELPSPLSNAKENADIDDLEMELDLEAELEQALETVQGATAEAGADESSESEEE